MPASCLSKVRSKPAERLVGADEADQVGGDVAGRVVADRVALGGRGPCSRRSSASASDLVGQRGRHPAGDVLEPAALLAQRGEGREVVDVEPVGEELRELRRLVGGQLRVGDDHQPVDRVGQRLAVAVEDVAALGRAAPTSTVPSAAAIAAYALGSTPCSCTSRAPKTESTIAITTKPNRSRNSGEPRRLPRGRWVRARARRRHQRLPLSRGPGRESGSCRCLGRRRSAASPAARAGPSPPAGGPRSATAPAGRSGSGVRMAGLAGGRGSS